MRREMADFAHDIGDGASAFLAARIRNDAERATHVAALHDGNEGAGFVRLRNVVADGVLRAFLLGRVAHAGTAQRVGGIIHAGFQPPLEDGVHILENLVVFLRADDDIQIRQGFEKLLAARLRHAAHEAVNDVFPVAALVDQVAHLAERLLLRLIPNGASVDEHGVGLVFVSGDRVAAFGEHFSDLFGVALVHLAAVGFDVNFGHLEEVIG